jgi:hypothetical protein
MITSAQSKVISAVVNNIQMDLQFKTADSGDIHATA